MASTTMPEWRLLRGMAAHPPPRFALQGKSLERMLTTELEEFNREFLLSGKPTGKYSGPEAYHYLKVTIPTTTLNHCCAHALKLKLA